MAYEFYLTTQEIFWTHNSEWKPSPELFDYKYRNKNWTKAPKCSVNFVDTFTISVVLPTNNYTMLKIVDTSKTTDNVKFYVLKAKLMEMNGGYLYEGTLDVWCTYGLDFVRWGYNKDYPVFLERYLNNYVYRTLNINDIYIGKDDFFNYDNLSYVFLSDKYVKNDYKDVVLNNIANQYSAPNEKNIRCSYNFVYEKNKYIGEFDWHYDPRFKLGNVINIESRNGYLFIYQNTNGKYIVKSTGIDNIEYNNSENNQNIKFKDNTILYEQEYRYIDGTARLPLMSDTVNESYYRDKLTGVFKDWGIGKYLSFNIKYDSDPWDWKGINITQTSQSDTYPVEDDKPCYFPTYTLNPDDLIPIGSENYGWSPSAISTYKNGLSRLSFKFATLFVRDAYCDVVYDNERRITPYISIFKYNDNNFQNDLNYSNYNVYLQSQINIYDLYFPNFCLSKPSPNSKAETNYVCFGKNGGIGFNGYNFYIISNIGNASIISILPQTMNVSTDGYSGYINANQSTFNTSLQIAKDRQQVATIGAVGSFIDTTINAVGYGIRGNLMKTGMDLVKNGAVGNIVAGSGTGLGGIFGAGANFLSARNIYKHENMRINAMKADAQRSLKANNIIPNNIEDDVLNKIGSHNDLLYGLPVKAPSEKIDIINNTIKLWDVGMKCNYNIPLRVILNDYFFNYIYGYKDYNNSEIPIKSQIKDGENVITFIDDENHNHCLYQNPFIFFKMLIPEFIYKKYKPNYTIEELEALQTIFESGVRMWWRTPLYKDMVYTGDYPLYTNSGGKRFKQYIGDMFVVSIYNKRHSLLNLFYNKQNEPTTETSQPQNEPTTETCEPQDEPNNNESTTRVRRTQRKTTKTKRDNKK